MAILDLSRAIPAIRARPEEFEFSGNSLHHVRSRHMFHFLDDGDVQIYADCNCATLRASLEQGRVFHAAFKEWRATYWRGVEIHPDVASPFPPPTLWGPVGGSVLPPLPFLPPPAAPAQKK